MDSWPQRPSTTQLILLLIEKLFDALGKNDPTLITSVRELALPPTFGEWSQNPGLNNSVTTQAHIQDFELALSIV